MVVQSNTSFGGSQAPGDHFGVSCDECRSAIRGIRHKCSFCPNYDLCSGCRQKGIHNHHMMHEMQPHPPPHHQSNFPQPPTPYPQYPHPASPPNQYSNPPYNYPHQPPSQYPQAPVQYPYPQTNNPSPGYPSYPAYPGQTPPPPQYPSQGGQTPLPPSNPAPTQYPFSPSPYPHPSPSSTFSSPIAYQPYPIQYPHDQTSIQASSSTQQPPIQSVTVAQQTQTQNSNSIQAAVSPPSTASAQNTQMTIQAQSYPGVTTQGPPVVQGQTMGPSPFDGRPPHHSMRGFRGGFSPRGCHRRRHPLPTLIPANDSSGQLPDHNGVQHLMQRMVLSGNAAASFSPASQTPPVTSNHPTPAPPVPGGPPAPGGSDNLSTVRWSPAQQGIPSKRIPLQSSDEEHQRVIQRMKANGGDGHVAKVLLISRIENYTLFNIYKSCKEEMEREHGPGFQNERILWHGTSADVLDNIYRGGFNRSYCGKNATVIGKGVYFATSFSYSAGNTYSPPDAKGQKYIFQCRVLTGHFTQGKSSLNEPPMRTAELRYDSVVDNVSNPNMFVVFKDMQVYPEYVITLKA